MDPVFLDELDSNAIMEAYIWKDSPPGAQRLLEHIQTKHASWMMQSRLLLGTNLTADSIYPLFIRHIYDLWLFAHTYI